MFSHDFSRVVRALFASDVTGCDFDRLNEWSVQQAERERLRDVDSGISRRRLGPEAGKLRHRRRRLTLGVAARRRASRCNWLQSGEHDRSLRVTVPDFFLFLLCIPTSHFVRRPIRVKLPRAHLFHLRTFLENWLFQVENVPFRASEIRMFLSIYLNDRNKGILEKFC